MIHRYFANRKPILRGGLMFESRNQPNEAIDLRHLRLSRGVTQVDLAARLAKTQGNISEFEARIDVYLSSLREYVEALDGNLEVAAVFEDDRALLAIGARGEGDAGGVPAGVLAL